MIAFGGTRLQQAFHQIYACDSLGYGHAKQTRREDDSHTIDSNNIGS
jgi:hypothetical protein